MGRNTGSNPIQGNFHHSDVPISALYSGGLGLFGILFK